MLLPGVNLNMLPAPNSGPRVLPPYGDLETKLICNRLSKDHQTFSLSATPPSSECSLSNQLSTGNLLCLSQSAPSSDCSLSNKLSIGNHTFSHSATHPSSACSLSNKLSTENRTFSFSASPPPPLKLSL